jgi:hypothetical protein
MSKDYLYIIEIQAREDGGHGLQGQSARKECWMEGWIAIPEELVDKAWECKGYCDLVIQDGVLVDLIPGEVPETPEPEDVPTETEQLRADVDYIAVMTGVELA